LLVLTGVLPPQSLGQLGLVVVVLVVVVVLDVVVVMLLPQSI